MNLAVLAGAGSADFWGKIGLIVLECIAVFYSEVSRQCPTGIKKGLTLSRKSLNLMVGRVRFERTTIALKER